MEIKWKI